MSRRPARTCRGFTVSGDPCEQPTTKPSGLCGMCKGARPTPATPTVSAQDLGVSRPQTADRFRDSLLAHTRNAAKADPSRDAQTRQRLFCFNRLLYRIFSHPEASNGKWALKGAASLMARCRAPRWMGTRVTRWVGT